MPLNHVTGERLNGMDELYRVVPLSKYKELSRLTTFVKEMSTGKFKREITVERPIWEAALGHAQIVYYAIGAPLDHLSYDVLVQEYPRTGQVAFLFCAKIGGEDHYVVAPFSLAPEQIADLKVRNLWQPMRIN
jgi:hypothetical protein